VNPLTGGEMKLKPVKPPIGIMPRELWLSSRDEIRLKDIKETIVRYVNADKPIPDEWIEEYKYLIKESK